MGVDQGHPAHHGVRPAPESDASMSARGSRSMKRLRPFHRRRIRQPGALFDVINPATGERIARVAQGSTPMSTRRSPRRARRCRMVALAGTRGRRHLYALARHVQKRERFLAVLETLDNGKPIRESRDIDMPLVARHFYHHAGWASLIESEFPGTQPVGVCGQIIPWNFPLLMLAWKIAPALAAGNTVVLKPAEFTPLTALAFAEICVEAGLPPGVVNIVTGDGATGAALVEHPGVDKIAFTGSTEVGRAIRQATAGTGKKLSLELGGKSPFIVFEDADLDSAVEGVVDAIWFNQGQVCCAGSRLLVQEGVADALNAKLRARMEKLRVGDPLDKSTDIGAIVAPVQLERIRGLRRGRGGRARILSRRRSLPGARLLLSADARHRRRAGLGAGARGNLRPGAGRDDLPHARRSGRARQQHPLRPRRLRVDREHQSRARSRGAHQGGVVWINSTNLFDAAAGFGGYRESGFGREGGREGMSEYLIADEPQAKPQRVPSAAPQRLARPCSGAKRRRAVRPHRQAVHRRQAGAAGFRLQLRRSRSRRPRGRTGRARQSQGHPQRGRSRGEGSSWGAATAHNRAQVLYYIAENLAARADEFARRLSAMTGASARAARPKSTRRSAAPSSTPAMPTSSTAPCTRRARASSRWR